MLFCAKPWGEFSDNTPRQGSWLPLPGGWCKQMQEVAGERGGYLHGRGGNNTPSLSLSVCYPFFLFLPFVSSTSFYLSMQPWTVMIYSISRSKWKLKRMQNASYVELRNGHLLRLRYPFMLLKEGEYCWSVMKLL